MAREVFVVDVDAGVVHRVAGGDRAGYSYVPLCRVLIRRWRFVRTAPADLRRCPACFLD